MSFGSQLDHERAEIMRRVTEARNVWAEAMRAHMMAPPDAGFAQRLQNLADAATIEQVTWEKAHAAGLIWRPVPGAENIAPPYELRPGTGRRGPTEQWERFDLAVAQLNKAITQPNASIVAAGFAEVADATAALSEAVAEEDRAAADRAAAPARMRGAA